MARGSRLAEIITRRRDDLVGGWEAGVRTLASGARAQPALAGNVPALLDWLAGFLETEDGGDDARRDAFSHEHAMERLAHGFDLVEVLAEWTLLRDVLLEAWEAEPDGVTPADVRRMNAELDHLIALSVVQFVRELQAGEPVVEDAAPAAEAR